MECNKRISILFSHLDLFWVFYACCCGVSLVKVGISQVIELQTLWGSSLLYKSQSGLNSLFGDLSDDIYADNLLDDRAIEHCLTVFRAIFELFSTDFRR